MKLIEMRCPNYGAPLSVNAERDEVCCQHCNMTFLIEDALGANYRGESDQEERAESPNSSLHSSSPASTSSVNSSAAQSGTAATTDGFPCNLDDTATFSGVTIPVDSTWTDNSPKWDWRHETFSNTAVSITMEDVQISISTFTGGDTKDAVAFMKDYADCTVDLDNAWLYEVQH